MTCASLCAKTKTELHHRTPLPKVSLFMYKALPAAAHAKAPSKTFLFGERVPGRNKPTMETSSKTSPYCQKGSLVPPVDQDHERRRPSLGANCGVLSRPMSRKEAPGDYIGRPHASIEGDGSIGHWLALATSNTSLYCSYHSAIHQTSMSRVLHRKVA